MHSKHAASDRDRIHPMYSLKLVGKYEGNITTATQILHLSIQTIRPAQSHKPNIKRTNVGKDVYARFRALNTNYYTNKCQVNIRIMHV